MAGLITPEMFGSDTPPDRIGGFETEYDVRLPDGKSDQSWTKTLMTQEALTAAGLSAVTVNHDLYVWLSNGAFLYPDCQHMEYATPESDNPYVATLALHAGNTVLATLLDASGSESQIFRRSATVDPVSGKIVTKGFHGNLCIPDSIANTPALAFLEGLFATQVTAWGGIVTKDGFSISPKANDIGSHMISTISNRTTTGTKPFAIVRNASEGKDSDTNAEEHRLGRLEDRTKTPSSPWSDFMGMAATSIMMRVREHPKLDRLNRKLNGLELWNSVKTFRSVAKDIGMQETYALRDGRKMTALNMQEAMAEIAVAMTASIELPASELYALQEWQRANDDLNRVARGEADLKILADRIGWVGKYVYLLKRFGAEAVQDGSMDVLRACLNWDRVGPRGAGQIFYEKRGVNVATESEAQKYTQNAPENTRAHPRAELIKGDGKGYTVTDLRWPYAKLKQDGITQKLSWHPYETELKI
jgi:hypothetical protein